MCFSRWSLKPRQLYQLDLLLGLHRAYEWFQILYILLLFCIAQKIGIEKLWQGLELSNNLEMNSNKFLWVLWIETHQTSFTHQLVPFLLLEKDNRGHFGELSVTSNCQRGCFAGSFTPFRLQEDSGFGVEGLRVDSGIVKLMDIFDDNCGGYNYHTFPIISKGVGSPSSHVFVPIVYTEIIPLQMLVLFEICCIDSVSEASSLSSIQVVYIECIVSKNLWIFRSFSFAASLSKQHAAFMTSSYNLTQYIMYWLWDPWWFFLTPPA